MSDRKKKMADKTVETMIEYRIKMLKEKHNDNGWICWTGMDKRIEHAKRKINRIFSLQEIALLYDIYSKKANETTDCNILSKHPFTKDEVVEIITKANAIVPFIHYHNLKNYLES